MQAKVESLSPSAHKPLMAVESWRALGIALSITPPTPVTREELARAHDRAFVDAILECRAMNGFLYQGTGCGGVSSPHERRDARGGAGGDPQRAGGRGANLWISSCLPRAADKFCTFNGLMVRPSR